MASDFNRECHIFEPDITFDEAGSKFLALRKIQWVKKGDKPDESKAKLELRKWFVDKDGIEIASKGFSFLTEEGPHELTKVLVKEGYGNTKDILNELRHRSDFVEAAKNINNNEEDSTEGEYFDIRSLISDDDNNSEYDIMDKIMDLPEGNYGGVEVVHF